MSGNGFHHIDGMLAERRQESKHIRFLLYIYIVIVIFTKLFQTANKRNQMNWKEKLSPS